MGLRNFWAVFPLFHCARVKFAGRSTLPHVHGGFSGNVSEHVQVKRLDLFVQLRRTGVFMFNFIYLFVDFAHFHAVTFTASPLYL